MNGLPLEHYIKSVADTLESTADAFNVAMTEKHVDLKISALCEITGELSGALAHLHDVMELEVKNQKSKKSWKFWK